LNAPAIWIVFPAVVAIGLFIFRRWTAAVQIVSLLTALILAWLAWQLPIGTAFSLNLWAGFPALNIGESLNILGVELILTDSSRPMLIFIYLSLVFWFTGALTARTDRLFIPWVSGLQLYWLLL